MTRRPILVDVTRLVTRVRHTAPTGIDRVDFAYARRFLDGSPDRSAVILTPYGARMMPPAESAALLRTLGPRWHYDPPGSDSPRPEAEDAAAARLSAWLRADPAPPPPRPSGGGAPSRLRTALSRLGWLRMLGWPEARRAPEGAIYLHTSHLRLDRPDRLAWLAERADISPVFFVHDLIPLEYPEYVVPGEAGRHRVRMATIARHGAAVVTNSRDVAARFRAHLAASGLRDVPAKAAPLGVEPAFATRPGPLAARRPYFVACSTIEARKNHLLLLQIWRELARELGAATPALVIVGRRGWESESAADLLDRCPALAPHVIEAPGLPTADLARLLAGARALLMPSFAEGYGIPVVEALSVGAPTICSDIPAHREVAAGAATLLDPLDGTGWRHAILDAMAGRPPGSARPATFRRPTWEEHFAIVDHVLASLPGESGPGSPR